MTGQALLGVTGGILLILSTFALVRRGLLSIRYGMGWLAVSMLAIIGLPLLVVFSDDVRPLGFSPTGFSVGVFIVFIGLVCLQLSVSISGLHKAIQDLAEHAALTEERLREIEHQRKGQHP